CVMIAADITAQGEQAIQQTLEQFCQHYCPTTVNTEQSASARKNHNLLFNKDNYKQRFKLFHQALLTQQFKKLVLSYPYQQKKAANFSLLPIFKAACQKYPTAFVYVAYSPLCGIWLGASPELLAKKQQSNWLTMALAGTQHTTQLSRWD